MSIESFELNGNENSTIQSNNSNIHPDWPEMDGHWQIFITNKYKTDIGYM